jgi:hypothetical protein
VYTSMPKVRLSSHWEGTENIVDISDKIVTAARPGFENLRFPFDKEEWPWKVLGRTPTGTTQGLRNAEKTMRELALAVHPDKSGNKEQREEAIKVLNQAWGLIKPKLRSRPIDVQDGEYVLDYGPAWDRFLCGRAKKFFEKLVAEGQAAARRRPKVLANWVALMDRTMLIMLREEEHGTRLAAFKEALKKLRDSRSSMANQLAELQQQKDSLTANLQNLQTAASSYKLKSETARHRKQDVWQFLQSLIQAPIKGPNDVRTAFQKLQSEKHACDEENKRLTEEKKQLLEALEEYRTEVNMFESEVQSWRDQADTIKHR